MVLNRTVIYSIALVIAVTAWARAGDSSNGWTGNPKVDMFSSFVRTASSGSGTIASVLEQISDSSGFAADVPHEKSPWIAGALSLAVPGAGEFYSESYVKSALFLAAEAAGWVIAYNYDKKGDRQTDVFQNYADQYWNVVEYALWVKTQVPTFPITIDQNASLAPWLRVNWEELNAAEGQVSGFSHRLPPHGDQQYYELIGKYVQYSPGWNDFDEVLPLDGSPNFYGYAQMRKKANDFYDVANISLSLLVVNHILSAIDAYFTAAAFNNSVKAEARLNMRPTPWGSVPEAVGTLSIRF
jgi:hypothetical protein